MRWFIMEVISVTSVLILTGCTALSQKDSVMSYSVHVAGQGIAPPVIASIEPSSGTIGTEIVIQGTGFDPLYNDIAFSHPQIQFGGRNTAYLNEIPSPDGKTLRFVLPDVLGACAFSQMQPREVCPSIGLPMPVGTIAISVINRRGQSNAVLFERVKSQLEIAEELIYQSPEYHELWKILDEIVRKTGRSVSTGVRQRGEKIFLVVWIERDIPSLSRRIPSQIAGFDVWVQRGRISFAVCAAGPDQILDDEEILQIIKAWLENRSFEDCGVPTDEELLQAIDAWISGTTE